jgi:outer membrane lipoprotein carrier protein
MRYLFIQNQQCIRRQLHDRKYFSIAGVVVTTMLFFVSRFVHADPAEELVALLEPLNSMSGHFQQTLVDDKGALLQSSEGVFSLRRPGLFRWQTLEPFPQLLVSNQRNIWLYDEDLEQVIIRPYTEAMNKTPALLLSGDPRQLSTHYRIVRDVTRRSETPKSEKKSSGRDDSDDTFILISKNEGEPLTGSLTQPFTQIVLLFKNRELSQMELTDTVGQISLFRFTNIKVNAVLAADIFTFEPPPGIDVIFDD